MADGGSETGQQTHEEDHLAGLDQGCSIPKRHARVTVKYNRKELQKRLDVEKWIEDSLDQLYQGQEGDLPEEVNIDELIDLPSDGERVQKLQELLRKCKKNTKSFVSEMTAKLEGVYKEEELQTEGVEHPVIGHSHYRHEPYHFNNPQHQRSHHNQTL